MSYSLLWLCAVYCCLLQVIYCSVLLFNTDRVYKPFLHRLRIAQVSVCGQTDESECELSSKCSAAITYTSNPLTHTCMHEHRMLECSDRHTTRSQDRAKPKNYKNRKWPKTEMSGEMLCYFLNKLTHNILSYKLSYRIIYTFSHEQSGCGFRCRKQEVRNTEMFFIY